MRRIIPLIPFCLIGGTYCSFGIICPNSMERCLSKLWNETMCVIGRHCLSRKVILLGLWLGSSLALRTFYAYLQKQGVVENSPLRDITLPKIHKSLPSFVRPEEMDLLLDEKVADDDFSALRDKLILSILYMTGIRRAELVGLLDKDVDTQAMQIKVTGKRNKQRIIPFGNELKDEIEAYRRMRRIAVGMEVPNFFVKDDGKPLYVQFVYRLVARRLGEVTTLARKSPHILRHTFASAMLNGGAGLNSVKELLGHQSIASTQIYTHITFEELKRDYKQAHPRATKKGGHYGN